MDFQSIKTINDSMKEAGLVAQRLVYEGVVREAGLLIVDINENMINFYNKAHSRYSRELEHFRDLQKLVKKGSKKKGT